MNAPIHIPATLPAWLSNDTQLLVCAWRGACVELFGRAECAISDAIEALDSSGYILPTECRHEAPRKRAEALLLFIENQRFGGHENAASRQLKQLISLLGMRNQIVHATITIGDTEIVRRHHFYAAAKRREEELCETWFDALKCLNELNDTYQKLQNALRQITAHARKFAA